MAGSLLLAASPSLLGDVKSNPFLSIVERNAFGLKPPPPPAPVDTAAQEKKPPVNVKLTGITSILDKTKALVEITDGPGKTVKKRIMVEGERDDSVEVVAIDVKKNTVTFKIGEVVTNITFEVVKSPAGPAAPGVPVPGVPGRPPFPATAAVPPSPGTAAMTPGFSAGGSGRGSVVVVGNSTPAASPAAAPPMAARSSMSFGASGGLAPSANVTVSDGSAGLRTIPSRVPRATTATQPQGAPVDPAVQYLNLRLSEEAAKARGIPHPPTPPIPGLE